MRSIFQVVKLRDKLRRQHFNKECGRLLDVRPENCNFNEEVDLDGTGMKTRVCGLVHPKKEGRVLFCNTKDCAQTCNAYAPVCRNKEEVVQRLLKELPDPVDRLRKYPDVAILEWVLAEEMHEARTGPSGIVVRALLWIISKLENLVVKLHGREGSKKGPDRVQ